MHARARLLTLPLSHYCEKARWALDATGVEYVEEPHLPLLHRRHTRRVGGGSVPVLVTPSGVLTDSAEIVRYADQHSRRRPLLSIDPTQRAAALEFEQHVDRELGPHARRWAYHQLLPAKRVLNRCVVAGVPRAERAFAPLVMAVARPLIRRGFRITPDSAARSLERVHAVFDAVDGLLADGRRWLVGSEFGLADLAFAALAAPVLLPREFGGAVPAPEAVPPGMRAEVLRLRDTPAGRHAARTYAEHRR